MTAVIRRNVMTDRNRLPRYILESWATEENPWYTTEELLEWIEETRRQTTVSVQKIPYSYDGYWHYDKDELGIINDQHAYFSVKGIYLKDSTGEKEQPIIIQDGIGYLGILAKIIDGRMYFLMQTKIEPGNINYCQISPTIQATRSNFTRKHGGKEPAFYSYFVKRENCITIADQIQSEQSSRFLGKRNRNMILLAEDEVEVPPTHRWMTLGQIKKLMQYDNIVNMDTRSVISCIPFVLHNSEKDIPKGIKELFHEEAFLRSFFNETSPDEIRELYAYIGDVKMDGAYERKLVDLFALKDWSFDGEKISSPNGNFRIVFCDIEIEGREVRTWSQPLLEAAGKSEFGLPVMVCKDGILRFLVQAKSEIGCFDRVEVAPAVQKEPNEEKVTNAVEKLFFEKLEDNRDIRFRGLFSEEGGRFYHEENWNTIMEFREGELEELPPGYFWVSFQTLNILIQFNNCLNIQLRNLISLLEL